jgi:tetratricopeptide (TPR) repeat protein
MNNTRLLMGFILGLMIAAIGFPLNVCAQMPTDEFAATSKGKTAFLKGSYADAEAYFREAVRTAEAVNATPGRLASALGNLAQALVSRGSFREAEALYDRALKAEESAPVEPKVRTILLLNLSVLYTITDRLGRAESVLDDVVVRCKKYFGSDSPEMANALKLQGIVYAMTKRLSRAESSLKESLAIAEKLPALPPAELATILTSLAGVYSMQQKWNRADPLSQRAVELLEGSLGPEHPFVADVLVNVGEQRILQHDYIRAEAAFRRGLAIRKAVFGKDHVEAALVATRLATVLTALRKNEEAYSLFVASLPVQERVLGPQASRFATSLEEFGKLLRQMEDTSQAETIEARARSIRDIYSYTVSADQLLK